MNKLDFKNPNPKTLSRIDSFFQNSTAFKNEWNRIISNYYPREGTDNGWESVQKDHPEIFQAAWVAALWQMKLNGITAIQEQINEF